MSDGRLRPPSRPWQPLIPPEPLPEHPDPQAVAFSELYQAEVEVLHLRGQTDWRIAHERFQLARRSGLSTAIHLFWYWLSNSIVGQPDDNFLKGLLLVPVQLEGEQEQFGEHTEHWELPGLTHLITFDHGQWTCLPAPMPSEFVAAGPGPLQPDYPADSALLHNYRLWAAGDLDVFGRSFVWDSQKVWPNSPIPWARWELLDRNVEGWRYNPNPLAVPQKMVYRVTSRSNWGHSQTHRVVFSVALHQAFQRAKWEFNRNLVYGPTARGCDVPAGRQRH